MKKLFTLVVALVALLSVACENGSKESGGAISITSSTEVTIGKYATEFEISYKADSEAEVTLTAEWLRVRHHEEGTVTIQVEDNETGGTRMAAVTLAVGSELATVVVNQLGVAEEPTITLTTGDTIDVKRTGCKVKIDYTIENSNPVDYVFVKCDADWIYSMDTQTEGVVELGVATNTTGKSRETLITVGYGTATATTTLRQAGDGEIVFNAPIISGDYLGDALTPGTGNYWFFFTDRGFDGEGNSLPNATYYRIDAYGPVSTDVDRIRIPNGTYTYDPNDTYAEWTFTAEYSGFWVTDAEGRRGDIEKFDEGTLVVESDKMTLKVKINGVEHTAIYEGNATLIDSRGEVTVYTTLDGDYEADLSDHYMVYACEGDYYDFGYFNWMFIIAPNSGSGDCFQLDIITGYNDKESGFAGEYVASDYLAKWSFIPGWTNMSQLLCSWFFTADQSELAPFRDGKMSVKDNGDGTLTVDIEAYDDRRNKITGHWTGVPQEYEQ